MIFLDFFSMMESHTLPVKEILQNAFRTESFELNLPDMYNFT